MHCIVGLGNPEPRYDSTRHNIGFHLADELANSLSISFQKGKGEYLEARGTLNGSGILIVKPLTYMNRSGLAVHKVHQFYKIPVERMLIMFDELDLPLGTFRFRPRGGDAGNKGLRSIIEQFGHNEISRFRIGIRNKSNIRDASAYVLSKFSRKEQKVLEELIPVAKQAIHSWLTDGIDKTMNDYNRYFEF